MKEKKQRPDKLLVSTVATTGKWSSKVQKGSAYLTVQKGFNEEFTQVAIEVDHTSGTGAFKTHHKHETALFNITFGDANGDSKIWSGTADKLRELLFPAIDKKETDGFKPDEDSLIQEVHTDHTGGNIYNDVIKLKDGHILRISEGVIGLYKNEQADEEGDSLQLINY